MRLTTEEKKFLLRQRAIAASKQQCHEWFENYLFGPLFGEQEPNTTIEEEIFYKLHYFFSGGKMGKNKKDLVEFFKKLKGCKDYYKLLTPKTDFLYRGTFLPYKGITPEKVVKSDLAISKGLYVFKITYKPSEILQSWSADMASAAGFAIGSIGFSRMSENMEFSYSNIMKALEKSPPKLPTILKAKVDDSFFGSAELGNTFYKRITGGEQDEVFRLGKDIKCEALIPVKWWEEANRIWTF